MKPVRPPDYGGRPGPGSSMLRYPHFTGEIAPTCDGHSPHRPVFAAVRVVGSPMWPAVPFAQTGCGCGSSGMRGRRSTLSRSFVILGIWAVPGLGC
jgi:hypothetical protein